MYCIRLAVVAIFAVIATSPMLAQQTEIFIGNGAKLPQIPKPKPENYLAKCIANPDDPISCHLARTANTDAGLENHVRGDVAPSAYVACQEAGGVCLELATLDLNEKPKARLPSIDVVILFDFDAASIREGELAKLKQLASAITSEVNAKAKFAVIGHTDSKGTDLYNCSLSRQRARAVTDRLAQLGVPLMNLLGLGVGEKLLKTPADGEDPSNRRVGLARITGEGESIVSKLIKYCQS